MTQIYNTIIGNHGSEFIETSELIAKIKDMRFIDESIEMARAAFVFCNPEVKLVHRGSSVKGEMTYHDFFRINVPDLFRFCRNVKSAADVLEILISESKGVSE